MSRIIVELPLDRNYCGRLSAFDESGRLLCGPFAVAGRAGDALAQANGNPKRNPLLRYGDTPFGSYRAVRVARDAGVIVMEAVSGDAALAEANGRYRLFIQGGAPAPNGALRSSAGALRVSDGDLAALIAVLGAEKNIRVDVVADEMIPSGAAVFIDDASRDEDPPEIPGTPSSVRDLFGEVSRRDALRAGAAGASGITALSLSVSFIAVGTPTPAHAYTQMAYNETAEPTVAPPAPETPPSGGGEETQQQPQEQQQPQQQEGQSGGEQQQQGMQTLSPQEQNELRDAPNSGNQGQAVQLNPGANTPEAQQIQNGQTGGGGTPPTPAPQISGGAAARQGNTASTGSSAGAAASSAEGAAGSAGAPFDNSNPGSGSSAPAVSESSSTATPAADPSAAKRAYFQQMNDAGKIADPNARNAAINKANADYAKALSVKPADTLPTNPQPATPPPPTATTPAKPPPTTSTVLDKSGN